MVAKLTAPIVCETVESIDSDQEVEILSMCSKRAVCNSGPGGTANVVTYRLVMTTQLKYVIDNCKAILCSIKV